MSAYPPKKNRISNATGPKRHKDYTDNIHHRLAHRHQTGQRADT